jgi:hypothetical protein
MDNELYERVLERLLSEEDLQEFSGAGAIGGVATPLGAGPAGKIKYKSAKATDKQYRNKSKKKKNKSPQYYLRKKSLKENAFRHLFSDLD